MTEFDLYLDLGGEIVPYVNGPHLWSHDETQELLQNGQFVLLYNRDDAPRVESYLATRSHSIEPKPISDAAAIIADGMAEFLKTLYEVSFSENDYGLIKGLTLALSKFLLAYPQLSEKCLQLALHDPYSFYHSARVAAYAVALGLNMQDTDYDRLWDMAMGAFLHDLGNLSISSEILNYNGSLTEIQWQKVRQHPEEGLLLLGDIPLTRAVRDIIFYHHERLDGGGYPRRLQGSMISFEIRIVSFADVFAALTVPRSYQKLRSPIEAMQFIEIHLLRFLDPQIFRVMQQLVVGDQVKQNQEAI